MSQTIVLEALYPEMEEATIGRWLISAGEQVVAGQPLAELITDKVAYEYHSPVSGTILVVLSPEKSIVPVFTTLAVIGKANETVENLEELIAQNRHRAQSREESLNAVLQATSVQQNVAPVQSSVGRTVRATPAARRLARERGIDLSTTRGTGPDGMITVDDLA